MITLWQKDTKNIYINQNYQIMKIRLTLKKKIIFSLLLVPLGFALYVYGAPLPKINEAHFKKNMYTKNTENTMTLSDGRILGYAVYGNPNGFPVFYFHDLYHLYYELRQIFFLCVQSSCLHYG